MASRAPRFLVVGGGGLFGGRVARNLRRLHPDATVTVTSRSERGARAAAAAVPGGAVPAVLRVGGAAPTPEAAAERARLLREHDVVVHAAGPWDTRGGYALAVEACEAGTHYVDLADCRHYVAGFRDAVEGAAARAGVAAVTGASTAPAVTAAVLRRAERALGGAARSARVVISGALRTPFGAGTVASVLGYAGERFERRGAGPDPVGWRGLTLEGFRGRAERRLVAAVRTPCLDVLPAASGGGRLDSVTVSAGVGVAAPTLAMFCASLLPRAALDLIAERAVPRMATLWARLAAALPEGMSADDGVAKVSVLGEDAGGLPRVYEWSLSGRGRSGLEVPCAPAVLLASRLGSAAAAGSAAPAPAGAHTPASPLLELEEIEAYLEACAGDRIHTHEHVRDFRSPLAETLGTRDLARLDAPLAASHSSGGTFSGALEVSAGRGGALARVALLLAGLPAPTGGRAVPTRVTLEARPGPCPDGADELYFFRTMGGRPVVSRWGVRNGTLLETFLPWQRFALETRAERDGGLRLEGRAVLPAPLQRWAAARAGANSTTLRGASAGESRLRVWASAPLLGDPFFVYTGDLRLDSVAFPADLARLEKQ